MLGAAALVMAVAAVFSGLLLLGENTELPTYAVVLQQQAEMAERGYDLLDLQVPRFTGTPLRILASVMRTPVLRRLIAKHLSRDNDLLEVRRVAAFVPDMPLYYPYIEPTHTNANTDALVLTDFSAKNAHANGKPTDMFQHWSISDYTTRYASGALSPVQVAKAFLAAAKDTAHLHIFIEQHDADILAQARASAARYAAGKPLGVLDGVPVAIKDEMEITGYQTTVGTSILAPAFGVATHDSVPVARLRAAGAVIAGKTNMHEIGVGITGFNLHYGTVRNPHNPQHYTGGSSSGSGAAVAAGLVPLAVGVDGGGSIRIPASMCGIVGIKPTFMRVPPLLPDCPSLAHIGPLAASVRDAAVGYAVLSGGDDSFPRSHSQPRVDLHSFDHTQSLKGLKVGYFAAHSNHSDPEVAAGVDSAMRKLQARGAELVDIELQFMRAIYLAHAVTISTEMAQNLDKFHSDFDKVSPESQLYLNIAREYPATLFLAAQRVRAFALRQLEEKVFSNVDVLVSPSTATAAPEIPLDALDYGEVQARQLAETMRFVIYGNLVGNPGVSVPIGHDTRGLPLALQIQARHWDEDIMLRVAHAAEELYAREQRQPQVYYSLIDDAAKFSKE